MENQDLRYARETTESLFREYGIVGLVRIGSGSRKSYHRAQSDGTSLIVYGIGMMDNFYASGFSGTYDYFIGKYGRNVLTGRAAVHALVLHEVAHAIQRKRGQRFAGSVHNSYFWGICKELDEKYPCGKVEDKLGRELATLLASSDVDLAAIRGMF